jgi:hypothetical protein
MLATNLSGTIFIRDNTPLPPGLAIESEAFLPGWRAVKNFDGSALARNIESADWNFFYLAGELRATVLGHARPRTLGRAVKRVLAKQEKQFNSLEITSAVSKRFLGIPFMRVAACTRHIQQGICLVPAKGFASGKRAPAFRQTGPGSDREQPHAEATTERYAVPVSST